jgi:hypothetical protein
MEDLCSSRARLSDKVSAQKGKYAYHVVSFDEDSVDWCHFEKASLCTL